MNSNSTVTVSLEPHLAQTLKHLLHVLPSDLSRALNAELTLTEIHYTLLAQISRWARTDAGQARLRAAQLDPREYDNIVSLLAGTRTSPSSKPPPDVPPGSESVEGRARRDRNDRKALVAVLNGLLSVGCAGGAAWWAADKSGCRDEWKVLLALMIATIVGVSETILFVIWQSRSLSSSTRGNNERQRIPKPKAMVNDKKSDDNGERAEPASSSPQNTDFDVQDTHAHLRHRRARVIEE